MNAPEETEDYQRGYSQGFKDGQSIATATQLPVPRLDCPVCGYANSFLIDAYDPSVGYCEREKLAYRIRATDKLSDNMEVN